MPKHTLSVLLLSLLVACGKQPVDSGPTPVPANWARMSAIRLKQVTLSGSDSIVKETEAAQAQFFTGPEHAGLTGAGAVTINGAAVSKGSNLVYYSEGSFGLSSKIEWAVAGDGYVQKFVYADTVSFPAYTGSMPTLIDRASGVSLLLDGTTVSGADSVRILIDDSHGHSVLQTFGAKAGAVSVAPAALSVLDAISNQTGVIAVMPYAGRNKVFSNKGFFFTREQRLYRSVNIQ